MSQHRQLKAFSASSLLSFGASLVLLWPLMLHAEDPRAAGAAENDKAAELGPGESRLGAVVASARLMVDEKTGKRVVEVAAVNPSDQTVNSNVEVVLTRTEDMPMARVMPVPVTVWSESYEFELVSKGREAKRFVLPAKLAGEIAKAEALMNEPADDDDDEAMMERAMRETVSFRVRAQLLESPPAEKSAAAPKGPASEKSATAQPTTQAQPTARAQSPAQPAAHAQPTAQDQLTAQAQPTAQAQSPAQAQAQPTAQAQSPAQPQAQPTALPSLGGQLEPQALASQSRR